MTSMDRREFLATASALVATFLLPRWAFASSKNSFLPDVSMLPAEVGRAYRLASGENDLKTLLDSLMREGGKTPEEFRRRLIERIHLDFEVGAMPHEALTFKFQGWIISRTEGRLCALQTF